jgi:hypothetical protein
MKKHRGLKRYYKSLATQNDFAKLARVDGQHFHFDRYGYGNNSFKRRKPHLDKLFRHFDLLAEQSQNLINIQIYAVILDFNSTSDALFLQKPSTDNWPFLFKVEQLSKASTLSNDLLDNYIFNLEGYQKLYGKADEAFCVLYKINLGLPPK